MLKVRQWLETFILDDQGPTAVEYAVMLALIIAVCVAAISTLGTNASSTFNSVSQAANPAAAAS
jgi:pilus assembly protein Flp/PilA